jgi:hypothetical protein
VAGLGTKGEDRTAHGATASGTAQGRERGLVAARTEVRERDEQLRRSERAHTGLLEYLRRHTADNVSKRACGGAHISARSRRELRRTSRRSRPPRRKAHPRRLTVLRRFFRFAHRSRLLSQTTSTTSGAAWARVNARILCRWNPPPPSVVNVALEKRLGRAGRENPSPRQGRRRFGLTSGDYG